MKSIGFSLLVLTGTLLGSRGENFRTDINPALTYYRAFLLQPDLPQVDSDYLFTNSWQGQKLSRRFGDLVARYDSQFKLARQAAQAAVPCDWGIDMSSGPATFLPQLARAKALAQVTQLRVPWYLQNGRQEDARDELLAAFALARNLPRDGTLISTLVQFAIEAIECSTVAANFGQFSPEVLQQLAAGLDALPAQSTASDCVGTEKALFLDWIRRKVLELQQQNPAADPKVMEGIRGLMGFEDQPEEQSNLWQRVTEAAGGTSEGVLKLLRAREQFTENVADFLKLSYQEFETREPAFRDAIEKSSNPFVATSVPSFIKARQREFRMQATLALVRAGIEYKLHGEAGLNRVSDPCGNGPFAFRRFVFQGVDRGFELRSAYNLGRNQAVLIFVEKEGPAFQVDGNFPGRPRP